MPEYIRLINEQVKDKKEKELHPLEAQSKAEKEVFKGKPISFHREKLDFEKQVKDAENIVKSAKFDLNQVFGKATGDFINDPEYQQAVEILKQNKKMQNLFLKKLNDYAGTYNIDNPNYLIKLSLDNLKRNIGEYFKRQGKKLLRTTVRQIPLATTLNPSLKDPIVKSNIPLERFPINPYESISISGQEYNFPPGEVKRYKKGTNVYAIEYNKDGTPKIQYIGDEPFLVPDKSGQSRLDPESAKFAKERMGSLVKGKDFNIDFSKYEDSERYVSLDEDYMYKVDLVPATSQEKTNYKVFNDAAKRGLITSLYVSRINNRLYASETPDSYLNSSNLLMSSIDEMPLKKVTYLAFDRPDRLNISIVPVGISREDPRKFQKVGSSANISERKDYQSMWAYIYNVNKFKNLNDERFIEGIVKQNNVNDKEQTPDEKIRTKEIGLDNIKNVNPNVKFASGVEREISRQTTERKENPFFLSGVANFDIKNKIEVDGFTIENSKDLRQYYDTKLKDLNIKLTPKLVNGIKKMFQIVDDFYDKVELYNQNTKGNKIPINNKRELFNYMTKVFYLNTFEKLARNISSVDVDAINLKNILRGTNIKEDYTLSSLYQEVIFEQQGEKVIDLFISRYIIPNKKKTDRFKDKEKFLNIVGKKLSEDVYDLINELS